MSITATRRRRRAGILGVAAAAAIGAASLVPAASAAPVDVVSPLTGSLSIDGTVAPIPDGTTFTGTWDDEDFTFQGDLAFPPITATVSVQEPLPTDVDVTLQISQINPMIGSWDPESGTAEASATLEVQITDLYIHVLETNLPVPDTCVFGPIGLNLTGTVADVDGNPALTLGPDYFAIPPATQGACGDLTDAISDALAGDNHQATIALSFAPDQEIPETTTTVPEETTTTVAAEVPTTTPDPGTPTDPPPAGGAAPISASPSYTG